MRKNFLALTESSSGSLNCGCANWGVPWHPPLSSQDSPAGLCTVPLPRSCFYRTTGRSSPASALSDSSWLQLHTLQIFRHLLWSTTTQPSPKNLTCFWAIFHVALPRYSHWLLWESHLQVQSFWPHRPLTFTLNHLSASLNLLFL